MIIIDQLRVSHDGTKLNIDAHVNSADYCAKVYIDSITIMTAEKVSETSPEIPTENYIYYKEIKGEEKELSLALTPSDFTKVWETDAKAMAFRQSDMSKTLFFVYIKYKGTPDLSSAPCAEDKEYTLGITFDEKVLYQKVMNYTKDLLKCCEVPLGFIDYILLWTAFKASISTGHYISAIKFFNLLFDSSGTNGYVETVKTCSCHG